MMQRQRDRAAGLNTGGFVSGYRGSPLGGYDQALWRPRSSSRHNDISSSPASTRTSRRPPSGARQQVDCFPAPRSTACSACGTARARASTARGDVLQARQLRRHSKHGGVLVLAGDDHGAKSSTTAASVRPRVRRGDDAGAVSGRRCRRSRPRPARLGDVPLLRLLGRLQGDRATRSRARRRSTSTRSASKIVDADRFRHAAGRRPSAGPTRFARTTGAPRCRTTSYAALHAFAAPTSSTAS